MKRKSRLSRSKKYKRELTKQKEHNYFCNDSLQIHNKKNLNFTSKSKEIELKLFHQANLNFLGEKTLNAVNDI